MGNSPNQNDPPPPEPRPGNGLWGWLGRQFGYVAKAVKTDVGGPQVIYRKNETAELPHPENPAMKLRRTVIDEVIVQPKRPRDDSH